MPCYSPLTAYRLKGVKNPETGKAIIKIGKLSPGENWEEIELPCGRCYGCRLDYKKQWAIRNTCETITTGKELSWFLTLTYNDENLPMPYRMNKETGELTNNPTLVPEDLQLFMKRLRYYYETEHGTKLRFYGVGEYGSKFERPHYHLLLWGLGFRSGELQRIGANALGQEYYTSEKIEKIWGKGFIVLGQVSFESCAYVSGYMEKKLKGDAAAYYGLMNIEPEFSRMSRKPGIGTDYFNSHPGMYKNDELILPSLNGALTVKPARFYDKLFDVENPNEMAAIKEKRERRAKKAEELQQTYATLLPTERKRIQEAYAKEAGKNLVRQYENH